MTPPGTRFHYVSFTFDLLVEALARRTGDPYEAALRRRVLEPLGMAATTFDPGVHAELASRAAPLTMALADGTFLDDDGLVAAYASLHLAGGGLWSSADDLLRLGRAMLRRGELDGTRVLSPAFVDLMTREVTVPGHPASRASARTRTRCGPTTTPSAGASPASRRSDRPPPSGMAACPAPGCGSTRRTTSCTST